MISFPSKKAVSLVLSVCIAILIYYHSSTSQIRLRLRLRLPNPIGWLSHTTRPLRSSSLNDGTFHWANLPTRYPPTSISPLPTGSRHTKIPKIQHPFPLKEDTASSVIRRERLAAVKEHFIHAWNGYRTHAWLRDEVHPLSGGGRDSLNGWAATLVDSLDSLWIMGLREEFDFAVEELCYVNGGVNFTVPQDGSTVVNTFETNIRYLGGLLGAYDLSAERSREKGRECLLDRAMQVGEMLYVAFDTPNRMPFGRWDWKTAAEGKPPQSGEAYLLAELGSFSLEFTRLSQLTGDPRYYDAIQRITEECARQQESTMLPGMFPVMVDTKAMHFGADSGYTLGAMADSFYEYLPKEYLLLNGASPIYRDIYTRAASVFTEHNFFRPMTPQNYDILISGLARASHNSSTTTLDASCQHLVCFAGGMVALAAKIFSRPQDLEVARKLTDGCIWAYQSMPNWIMAETAHLVPCEDARDCEWDEERWLKAVQEGNSFEGVLDQKNITREDVLGKVREGRLPRGYVSVDDRRYMLRPEAIESIFILYRITGDPSLREAAWRMFTAITTHTRTQIAHAALDDVTVSVTGAKNGDGSIGPDGTADGKPPQVDTMESFWLAETLKYFYLIFAEEDVVSLDQWVFNTEAHPFRRGR